LLVAREARFVMTAVPLGAAANVDPGTRYTSTGPAVRFVVRKPRLAEVAARLGRASVVIRNFCAPALADP
jgi:hypothetical protein